MIAQYILLAFLIPACLTNDSPYPLMTLPGEAPMACEETSTQYYRVSELLPPTNRALVDRDAGVLDETSPSPVNAAGSSLTAYYEIYLAGVDVAPLVSKRIADANMLIAIETCDETGEQRIALTRQAASGAIVDSVPAAEFRLPDGLAVAHGRGTFPLTALLDPHGLSPIGWSEVDALAFSHVSTQNGQLSVTVHGAFPREENNTLVASTVATVLTDNPDIDGDRFGDANNDDIVSTEEVLTNSFFAGLWYPDICLFDDNGAYDPTGECEPRHMSFGFSLRAEEISLAR